MPYIPPTITFLLESAGFTQGDPSYDDLKVTASTWSAFPSGSLPIWTDGWCVAEETDITVTLNYTAKVYSSYEYSLLRANPDFANVGNDPHLPLVTTVPYDFEPGRFSATVFGEFGYRQLADGPYHCRYN